MEEMPTFKIEQSGQLHPACGGFKVLRYAVEVIHRAMLVRGHSGIPRENRPGWVLPIPRHFRSHQYITFLVKYCHAVNEVKEECMLFVGASCLSWRSESIDV